MARSARSAPELRFVPVRPRDASAFAAMAATFHAEDGHPLGPAGRRAARRAARGDPLARAWFLVAGGVRVGYAVVTLGFSIEHGGRDGFIDDLYLLPAARGKGLGRAALAGLERRAAALGIGALHLEVARGNRRARAAYRRAGYGESGRLLLSKRLTRPPPA